MTMYDLIRMNSFLLEVLVSNGGKAKDVQHLAMFREYLRMEKEGHKPMYIVAFLSDEYGVSESTVYRVVARFKKELEY